MNERLILMTKRLFREPDPRQRPGVRRSSGAFERLTACGKLQRAGALQNAPAPVTLDENHIYIAGGYRDDFTAEAVIYEVKADSYRKAPSLPYAAMVGLVKMGEHVYCLGGEDKKQSRTDKFFRIPVAELLK
jgi:hypothetical protein